jgi:hypothetical protein
LFAKSATINVDAYAATVTTTDWARKERSLDYHIDEEKWFMKLSARNELKGTIVEVAKGGDHKGGN